MQVGAARGQVAGLAVSGRGVLPLAAVLLVALLLRVPLLGGGQIDYDEGVYWESLRALAAGHPLFTSVYSSQPPAFLLLLLPGHLALSGGIAGERLTVLVLALVGIVAVYRTGELLGGARAGLAAAAVLAADPIYCRQSITLQADGPAIALGLAAVALAAEARRRPEGTARDVLAGGAGAVLALATLTKLLALTAAPPVALLLVTGPGRPRLRPLVAAAAGGGVAAAALLLPFLGGWAALWRQAVGFHLGARGLALGGVESTSRWRELVPLLLGLAGLAVAVRRAPLLALTGAVWTLAAGVVLWLQHPLWSHHLVALAAPMALLAGGLALAVPARLPAPAVAGTAAAAAVAFVAASLASAQTVRDAEIPPASVQPSVDALAATTGPGDLVVTDDQFAAALAGRDTPPELVDTSQVRVSTGDLTAADVEARAARPDVRAVLMATGRLAGLPGFQAWTAAHFPASRDLGGGRILYYRPSG
jgi:4-amino-4-deoxy-L-arabinose transferase-like glycosyltransferase